ncbi:hypothetical protein FGB62_342g015 [Gracilaria domingensis]|nr:hypothetical protein FGB62_342g015 [Gracilaria domingensis]
MNVILRCLRHKKEAPGCSCKAAFMAKALRNQKAWVLSGVDVNNHERLPPNSRGRKQKRIEALRAALKKNPPSTLSIPFVTFMPVVDKMEDSNKPQTSKDDGEAKVTHAKMQCKAQDVDVERIAGSDSEDFRERIPSRFTRTLSWLQTDWSSRKDGELEITLDAGGSVQPDKVLTAGHGERRGSDPAVFSDRYNSKCTAAQKR